MHIKLRSFALMSLSVLLILSQTVLPAGATVVSPAKAKITFTFDDARVSTYTKAAPTLAKYGLSGTTYVTTDCVGMTKAPNACPADSRFAYMTWAQILSLKNTYKWEVGSHSKSHPYMASTAPTDGQPNMLTDQQITDELVKSKAILAAQGINATSFASPYGDYSPTTLQQIAKYYSTHRGFADQNDNVWPYNDLLVNNMQVQYPVTAAAVKAKIDYAIAHNTWLVLTFHDIVDNPSTNKDKYQWATSKLNDVASYVATKQKAGSIQAVSMNGGPVSGLSNLMPNGTFASGISGGWTTDNPGAFTADTTSKGSIAEVVNSIKINPSGTSGHLFSPKVAVDSNTMYVLKSYLNLTQMAGGEVGFYIDEYDASGRWISGQYKARETSAYSEYMNFSYVPSSVMVKSASLQVYSTASTTTSGYLDNIEWFTVNTATTAATNMMPGGTFDSGLSNGWRTDDATHVTVDTASHGSPANPINSLAINGTSIKSHTFSPLISIDSTKTYYLENYLNIVSIDGGEVGFYIDEYDLNGRWISGQYKFAASITGGRDVAFSYKPSSTSVAKASLQIIANNSASISAYFDNSRWQQL